MLRKAGLTTALLLALPAFANAWTLSAKIGSGAGSVTSNAVAGKTVAKTATGAPVIGYFKVADNVTQTITLTPVSGYTLASVLVDGVKVTPTAGGTVDVESAKANHTLVAYYSAVASSLALTQPVDGGGSITVQPLKADGTAFGAISRAGFASLKPGSKVRLTATPNADYTLTSLTFNGTSPQVLYRGVMGDVPYADVTIAAGANTASATFTAVPKVTARIAAGAALSSVNGYAGWNPSMNYKTGDVIPLDVTKSTKSNTADALVYDIKAFDETGAVELASGYTLTGTTGISFATAGKYVVKVTASAGGASSTAATPVLNVVSGNTAASATCTACHANRNTDLVDEYNASGHAANGHGPSCVSCHTTSATSHTINTVKFSACIGCHNGVYSRSFGTAVHFSNATSATFHNSSAAYVGYKGKGINLCSACHFDVAPHGIGAGAGEATFAQNTELLEAWAESGHGKRSGLAWIPSASHDWRNTGSTANFATTIPSSDCLRCHTAAGFAQFVDSNFQSVANVGAADGQRYNAPLSCNGCHVTDAAGITTGDRRAVPAVSTFYNISTGAYATAKGAPLAPTVKARIAVNFPDVGDSNICISCHSGRLSGSALVTAVNNGLSLSNSSFQNSHYMAAAGLMYMKSGFVNFTSLNAVIGTTTYGKTLTADSDSTPGGIVGGVTSTHRKLGTPAIIGDHGITAAMNLGSGGPCVACHMGYNRNAAKGHSLEVDGDTFNQVCVNCHSAEGTTTLTAANFEEVFVEEQAVPFQDALALALNQLQTKYHITYNSASYPYFYDQDNANKSVVDWTRGGALTAAQALKLEGACLNINLLSRDPAAYIHARSYARRLLYDSIDFLDDKAMNMSVGATAVAFDAVKYVKGATAAAPTTESYKYLAGYNRTSLAWNALQRP